MFANRVAYTMSPGGIRRGLIWQSSNTEKPKYKWVDRYPIGSVNTTDGLHYDMALGYTFPNLEYTSDFAMSISGITPEVVSGAYLKPGCTGSRGRVDYHVLNYEIYKLLDHVELQTTAGLFEDKDILIYSDLFHYYMDNTASQMSWISETTSAFGNVASHNFIIPVYSVFVIELIATTYTTTEDLPGLPAGEYDVNDVIRMDLRPDSIPDVDWNRNYCEAEKRLIGCPEFFQHIFTDGTAKIRVPSDAIATDHLVSLGSYNGVAGTDYGGGNDKFNGGDFTMISPYDGRTRTINNNWQNTIMQWRSSRASAQDPWQPDYYVKNTYSTSRQSMRQSVYNYSTQTANLYGLIPYCTSSDRQPPKYATWYAPVITFNSVYGNSGTACNGLSDYMVKPGTGSGYHLSTWLMYVLNGYELKTTTINEKPIAIPPVII